MNNHYVKICNLPPSTSLSPTQLLIWNTIQTDSLMDLEQIYSEIKRYCCGNGIIIIPGFIEVKNELVCMLQKEYIQCVDADTISIIIQEFKKREKEKMPKIVKEDGYYTWL